MEYVIAGCNILLVWHIKLTKRIQC